MTQINPSFDERSRLQALREYRMLDTPPEPALDDLTTLAATICEAPIALITLIDEHRQWFKSRLGTALKETPREHSFCTHALGRPGLLIVPDATQDARFAKNPLVTGEPGIRFYAGAPLVTPTGATLGTLCVIGLEPRVLTTAQERALEVLSRQVMTYFELHRHERELRESEDLLAKAFWLSPDCVTIVRVSDQVVIRANEAICQMLGRKVEEIIGHRSDEYASWLNEEERVGFIQRLDDHGECLSYEMTLQVVNGAQMRFNVSARLITMQGEPCILSVMRNVTATRRTESALEASELRYRRLFESAQDGILILDAETGMVVDVNPFLIKMLGFSHDQFMGKAIWDLGFFRDAVANEAKFTELREKEYVRYDCLPLETSDGRRIEVEFVSNVYLVSGSRVIQCNVRDNTERKRAGEALRFSEARFASVFRSSPAAIGIHLLVTERVIEANERLCEFSGWTHEELIGKTIDELGTWVDPAQRDSVMQQVGSAGSARDVEVQLRRRNGEVRDVLLSIERMEMPGESEPVVVTIFTDLTERKRAEAQLRLLETCVARLNDIVLITEAEPQDEPGPRIVFVNDAFVRRTGYTREEVLGKSPRFLQGPKTSRVELDRIHAAIKAWQPVRAELINYSKNGEEFWIELDIVPVANAVGWFTHWVAVERDITERKRTEETLQASEGRYRALFEHAPDGIVIADPESTYIDANASICRMLGYTREELIGRSAADIVVPTEVPYVGPALQTIKADVPYHREWKFRRKDGSTFGAEVIATLMPDGNLLGMIRDVTERKRSEDRFRRLVDSNAQGVIFWNTDGEITGSNDAFLSLMGYNREDLETGRMNWIAMTPPEYAEADERCMTEISAKGMCAPFEKEYIRKDGSQVPVLIGAASFEDNPQEGVCFVFDLTERKKLEQQFLRTQRMESIGTLAGGIAHDLNNTLGPIIMSLELLKMKFTDPGSQELLAIISSSARRGADMVSQVLSFARGVEGRRMEVQVKHLLREIEKIITDTFVKNIQVRLIFPHNLWTVTGDPTQLHQVLLNLCVNARDAMPNGGTLTIAAENLTLDAHYAALSLNQEARPGPYVHLQVTDSGTGISPEIVEGIFDPFFTTKELGKGTGLGLSTSLAIVKSHGGFIRVYSDPGKGTTFGVYLPAQTDASPESASELAAEMPRGNGELILVVDDEAAVRQITQQTLEAFGYRALLAADGTEAVALYVREGHEIAVVLTDMMMPVMDGAATVQVLRKINPAVRIIAASGLPAHVASLGVKHFLPKPFSAETLLKTLKRVLSEKA